MTVEYIGPEPLGTGAEKYYIQRIMVPPDCSAYSSNSVIVPVAEHVPMDQYDKTTGLMTSFIDIDTAHWLGPDIGFKMKPIVRMEESNFA